MTVNVPLLRQGIKSAQVGLQNNVIPTLVETLKALYVSEKGRQRICSMEEAKTVQGFQNSGFEESFTKYLRDSSAPEIDKPEYLQIAASEETANEMDGQEPCFLTVIQKDGRWDYMGLCRRNEYENRIPPPSVNELF